MNRVLSFTEVVPIMRIFFPWFRIKSPIRYGEKGRSFLELWMQSSGLTSPLHQKLCLILGKPARVRLTSIAGLCHRRMCKMVWHHCIIFSCNYGRCLSAPPKLSCHTQTEGCEHLLPEPCLLPAEKALVSPTALQQTLKHIQKNPKQMLLSIWAQSHITGPPFFLFFFCFFLNY